MTDLIDNTKTVIRSIKELGKKLNVPRLYIYPLIGRHNKVPFKDRYLFNVDLNSFGKINRISLRIRIYDYVDRIYYDASSLNMAGLITGIKTSQIRYRLITLNEKSIKIAGFHISLNLIKFTIEKEYTRDKAFKDRELYYKDQPLLDDSKEFKNIVLNEYNV